MSDSVNAKRCELIFPLEHMACNRVKASEAKTQKGYEVMTDFRIEKSGFVNTTAGMLILKWIWEKGRHITTLSEGHAGHCSHCLTYGL